MVINKSITYFIDSNVFLRVLVKENEKSYQDCFKLLEFVQSKKIIAITSDLVLAEINWVLESYYRFDKEKVILALEGIINLTGLKIKNATDISEAIEFYKSNKVKYIDAVIASDRIFKSNGIIISYDRDFDRLGIKRNQPEQVI